MGTEAIIGGLFGLGSAAASAASNHHIQSANAAAQADINEKTMKFNRTEAKKARDWQAAQSVIDRQFNSAEALKQRNFAAQQANVARTFDAQQALLARQFEERMSSSAHQREVNDLRLAGLNPILSATGGNGASTPSAPVIGAPLPTSSAATHSGSGGAQASIGALNAYMKKNVLGEFVNSALDAIRLNNDYIKAKAADKNADAAAKEAETHAKESVQRIEESISRVGLNHDEHELNSFRKLSEEQKVNLIKEQITSEITRRLDLHELNGAQKEAVLITAKAYAGLASAEAGLASIRGKLESERNPSVIRELDKRASMYESEVDKNKWVMSDPEAINKRVWHSEHPEYQGIKRFTESLGDICKFGVSLHGVGTIGSVNKAYQSSNIGFNRD